MRQSTDHILVSHAGNLPRPEYLNELIDGGISLQAATGTEYQQRLPRAVQGIVEEQFMLGVDIVNDGDFPKAGSYGGYLVDRVTVQSSNTFADLVANGIETPETIDQVKKQVDADLAEIKDIDESITRAIRMAARLRQIFLDGLVEKEASVRILVSSVDEFRKRLPNVTDSEWRQLLLDLGLTAEIKPNERADVRVSLRFTEIIKQKIAKPMPQNWTNTWRFSVPSILNVGSPGEMSTSTWTT